MIKPEKLSNALHALNAILIRARTMAYDAVEHARIAEVLDVAEYLPPLIADAADRTDEFREQVAGLAERFPEMSFALERFDQGSVLAG